MRKKTSSVEITLHKIFWQKILSDILGVKVLFPLHWKLKQWPAWFQPLFIKWYSSDIKCCLLSCRKWLYSKYVVLTPLVGIGRFCLSQLLSNWILFFIEQKSLEASLSAVRVLVEERHHYLQGTMEKIIFYLKNVNCCWNSHQHPCFLMIAQF